MKYNDPHREISKTAPKHRVYCPSANRQKLLFETERKALNFIRYNGETIAKENGYRPIRAYYCTCCGGYHTTSQQHNTLTEEQLDAIVERGETDSIGMKLGAICRNTERRIESISNLSFENDDETNDAFSVINGARNGIDGYDKLASHLKSEEHVANVQKMREKLMTKIAELVSMLNAKIDENITSENFYEAGRFNRYTRRMVAMLKYIDHDSVYSDFITETNEHTYSMHKIIKDNGGEYKESTESKVSHYLEKVYRFSDPLDRYMENKQYDDASKAIHLSLKFIGKIVNDVDKSVLEPIVSKLYSTKQMLMEIAPESDIMYRQKGI